MVSAVRSREPAFGFTVPADEYGVVWARRRVVTLCRRWRLPLTEEALRDVELCASEILANAVRHTSCEPVLRARYSGDRLRVEVIDPVAGPVTPVAAHDDDEHGRGLQLVQALAVAWGSAPTPGGGKNVWFEVCGTSRLPGSSRLTALVRTANPLSLPLSRFIPRMAS